jgi:cytochrome c1
MTARHTTDAVRTVVSTTADEPDVDVVAGVDLGMKWRTGDAAAGIPATYGRHRLQDFARSLGTPYATLLQWRRVARRFPSESRRDGVPWGVYQALASEPDRLDLIERDWTTLSALAFVRARREADDAAAA